MHRNINGSDSFKNIFTDCIFNKRLIEKWLDFYVFQLKRDLFDEAQYVLSLLDSAEMENKQVKNNITILDTTSLGKNEDTNENRASTSNNQNKKKLKSKLLFDSIKVLLLLINKITRFWVSHGATVSKTKSITLAETISMKRIKLDIVFDYLIESMSQIISYFLNLNSILSRLQIEQQNMRTEMLIENSHYTTTSNNISTFHLSASKTDTTKANNFITLKQSNEIVKEFHSISNTIVILVTSIKEALVDFTN